MPSGGATEGMPWLIRQTWCGFMVCTNQEFAKVDLFYNQEIPIMLLSVETQHEVPPKWSRPPQPSRTLLDVHIGQNYFLTFILGKTTSPTLLSCLATLAPDLAWAIIRPGGLTWPFPALTDVRVFVLYKRARAQLPLSVRHQPPFSTDMWATIFCEYYWRSQ